MSILVRLPASTSIPTLERALSLLGLRLAQDFERSANGERIYTTIDPLHRPNREPCHACLADGRVTIGQILVGKRAYCTDHWRSAHLDVEVSREDMDT